MLSDISCKETLHCFRNHSMMIYFERKNNALINNFIAANFKQLIAFAGAKDIDFYYLPYLFQDKVYQAIVNYNLPYLKTEVENIEIQQLYNLLISRQSTEMFESGLLLWGDRGEYIETIPLKTGNDTQFFESFQNAVIHFADEIQRKNYSGVQNFEHQVNINDEVAFEPTNEYSRKSTENKEISKADENFEIDAFRLADEIRERIQQLKEFGSLSLITDLIEELNNASQKLSSICITSDYRIFLKDYGMREVEMTPLPKSVFILFLRYPEGILFKELIDYYDELLLIYRKISVYDDIERSNESIRALTDPLNGSINEKCSRIRAAFLEVITDKLAQNYYITGKRGEPKKIILDRRLVEFR